MSNILLQNWQTAFDTAPFSKIKTEDFLPAFDYFLEKTKKDVQHIAQSIEKPTFYNTIEAMEFVDDELNRISNIIFNISHAENTPEIHEITQKISPILSNFSNEIIQNKALFLRIKAIFEERNNLNLTSEQHTVLENRYKEFVRNGAELSTEKQAELTQIDEKLSTLSITFGNNVLKDTQNFTLWIEDEKDLAGLPDFAIAQSKQRAIAQNEPLKWAFGLDFPSYIPFMTYLDNRDLRKKMFLAYNTKGFQDNENNNVAVVKELVALKHQRAKLLSYDSPAHFTLSERMASSPKIVYDFLDKILSAALPVAKKEIAELTNFAKKLHEETAKNLAENVTENTSKIFTQIEKWDFAYYSEKLKKEKFDIDDELLKPYFEVNKVRDGIFSIAKRLFGLTFKENTTIDKYYPDMQVFEVYFSKNNNKTSKNDKDEYIGILYVDFFARKNKKNGAWMTTFFSQHHRLGGNMRPHISIVCNFPEPTETLPSLLTFNDVTTLFHEFGHALHGLLSQVHYPSVAGTNTKWDFVELPSQFLENWAYQAESLSLFAQHYQTQEIIPISFIQKIKESANFMSGYQTLRQVSFGLLDMHIHDKGFVDAQGNEITDLELFENQILEKLQILPKVPNTVICTAFSHIFQGGYASAYYSYKWAEVLEADAFSVFEEKGIFDENTAKKFKTNILEKGGSENPMKLYQDFRGSTPNVDALLKKSGLL